MRRESLISRLDRNGKILGPAATIMFATMLSGEMLNLSTTTREQLAKAGGGLKGFDAPPISSPIQVNSAPNMAAQNTSPTEMPRPKRHRDRERTSDRTRVLISQAVGLTKRGIRLILP